MLCLFGLYEKRFQHMFSFLLECFSPLGNMLIKLIMKIAQIYLNVLGKVYLTLAVIETSVAFHIYVWVRVRSYTLHRHSILLYIYRTSWNLTYTLCVIIKYVFSCLCYRTVYCVICMLSIMMMNPSLAICIMFELHELLSNSTFI